MRITNLSLLLLCLLMVYSCKKQNSDGSNGGGPSGSSSSSVSYKVNGTPVTAKGDYNTQSGGLGSSFVHVPAAGTAANNYLLTVTSSNGTLLGVPVITASFNTGTYNTLDEGQAPYGIALVYGGNNYSAGFNSDSSLFMEVRISKFSSGRADGTFSGKMARLVGVDAQGNETYEYVRITDGDFKSVLVKQ